MFVVRTKLASSQIHGLGTFADEFIPRGSIIWVFHPGFDIEFALQDLDDLPPYTRERILHFAYVSTTMGQGVLCADDARFMNHSSHPNTRNATDGRGYATTIAARDILAGEEITCDYYEFDADAERKLSGMPAARAG
jgi:SET domain-containing protein